MTNTTDTTETVDTVDFTPSWQAMLPILLALVENGNYEGRECAKAELRRMAQLADLYVSSKQHGTGN